VKYLLDTNACISYLNDQESLIAVRLKKEKPADVVLCTIVEAELWYGAYKSYRNPESLTSLEKFVNGFQSIPFEGKAAREFGRIRQALHKKGTPIGPFDLQIAAIARVNSLTVVTHNTKEFSRVPDLIIEDWESPQTTEIIESDNG
jgi:tRNA(fMet)-specific endonuclease VapC